MSSLQPTPAVRRVAEYHPPLAGRSGLLLDFNENTLAPSPAVAASLAKLAAKSLTIYPEREPVERVVASALGMEPAQALLTNGVDEAIHLVCEAFLSPGDEVLLAVPTFGMYPLFAQSTGATVIPVQAAQDFAFPFEAMLSAITARTRLVAFATPNNPTGSAATREQILALCNAAPQAAIFVDEAYFHFHGETVLPAIATVPNLFVARTFSKAYGLAGLRIGLLAAQPESLRWVRKVASPYNVNSVALACLPAALEDKPYLDWYVQQALSSRGLLESALDSLGVPRWPSAANFVLCRIGPRHATFVTAMLQMQILVRDRSSDPGCDGCVRITTGTVEQMKRAIEAIRQTLATMQWQTSEAQQ
jgi:histidinol-phosphate aminotransferase